MQGSLPHKNIWDHKAQIPSPQKLLNHEQFEKEQPVSPRESQNETVLRLLHVDHFINKLTEGEETVLHKVNSPLNLS